MKMGASNVVKAKSGRFVAPDGSGYMDMAGAASTDIMGWVLGSFEATAISTDGATSWPIESDIFGKLFIMPACNATATAATEAEMQATIGETVDITMESTNYQYCDISLSAVDILLVLGYIYEGSAYGEQYAIVKVNHNKLSYTTHTT
jgi:hypothetical protein